MNATVDTSQLDAYAAQLARAVGLVLDLGEKIVSKGSLNVKNRARDLAPHGPHTPYYRSSIRYDLERGVSDLGQYVEGQIGADDDINGQANLSNIFEYGTARTPPIPHFAPAADEEEPRYYQACEDLAVRLVS